MTANVPWKTPASHPSLNENELHVWRISFEESAPHIESFRRVLSADEVARAERYRLEKLRNHFITARATLRAILSRYLDVEPPRVAFHYHAHGKPSLDGNVHRQPIRFNMSHSGDCVLYAVALLREVGVDVECHHLTRDLDGIVRRFFSAGEQASIAGIPESQRPAAFFRYWTVKEAYLKARGTGLAAPLDRFEVTFPSDGPPLIREVDGKAVAWSCCELPCAPGYSAAVVAEGSGWKVQCWQAPLCFG